MSEKLVLPDIPASPLYTEKQTAQILRVRPNTLARWRSGYGNAELPFIKVGRLIRYRHEDVISFILKQLMPGHGHASSSEFVALDTSAPDPDRELSDNRLYTAKETATILQLQENTLARWRCGYGNVDLPFVKIGGAVRYRKIDVMRLLQRDEPEPHSSQTD